MDLITKRLKFKDCNADKANELAKQYHIKADELEFVSKGFAEVSEGMEIKEGERAVIKYVSTVSVDRDGEMILPDGWLLDDFNKTKLFLYGHNYGGTTFGGKGQLPLGSDMWIKTTDKGLLAKQVYAKHEMAEDVYNLHKDGHPLPASVGFIPLKWVDKTDKKEWDTVVGQVKSKYFLKDEDFAGANRIYTKAYLLEHSDVPVACNPDALTLAVEAGEFKFKSLDLKKELLPDGDQDETLEERIKALENRIKELETVHALIDKGEYVPLNGTVMLENDTPTITSEPKTFDTEKIEELISKRFDKILDRIDIKRGKV